MKRRWISPFIHSIFESALNYFNSAHFVKVKATHTPNNRFCANFFAFDAFRLNGKGFFSFSRFFLQQNHYLLIHLMRWCAWFVQENQIKIRYYFLFLYQLGAFLTRKKLKINTKILKKRPKKQNKRCIMYTAYINDENRC